MQRKYASKITGMARPGRFQHDSADYRMQGGYLFRRIGYRKWVRETNQQVTRHVTAQIKRIALIRKLKSHARQLRQLRTGIKNPKKN